MGIHRRPYHRNCRCAVHKFGNRCPHRSQYNVTDAGGKMNIVSVCIGCAGGKMNIVTAIFISTSICSFHSSFLNDESHFLACARCSLFLFTIIIFYLPKYLFVVDFQEFERHNLTQL